MDAPIGTNMKLYSIMTLMMRKLESIKQQVWAISEDSNDTCGTIGLALADYSDETLLREIEMRGRQIDECRRRLILLQQGQAAYNRAIDRDADVIYQRYCGRY